MPDIEFGSTIRRRREGMRISQQRLADLAGTTLGHIYKLETGKITNPHLQTLEDVSKALGMSGVLELLSEAERGPGETDTSPTRAITFSSASDLMEFIAEFNQRQAAELEKTRT